ncbi:hypothetical protein ABZ348_03575 [Streptomyces sp. NPDC005963]|uniref:hypothetical protein n=1 Tax=Streptomyces sp. NPDC005963 TaxID=3156721 RepID=UPI0033C2DB18
MSARLWGGTGLAIVMGAVPVLDPVAAPAWSAASATVRPGETAPAPTAGPSALPGTGTAADTDGKPGAAPLTVAGALAQLQTLYRQAGAAETDYRTVKKQLVAQRTRTIALNRGLKAARKALAASRDEVGRIAREQYQGRSEVGELSRYLQIFLGREPQRALDERHLWERVAADRLATLDRLRDDTRRATTLAAASRQAYDRELKLAARQQEARRTAADRLAAVEELLASLSPDQLTALAAVEGGELTAGGSANPSRSPEETATDDSATDTD